MKICSCCKQTKLRDEFYKDKSAQDGLTSTCKECQKKRSAEYYDSIRGKLSSLDKIRRKENYDKWKAANPDRYRELMEKHNADRKVDE